MKQMIATEKINSLDNIINGTYSEKIIFDGNVNLTLDAISIEPIIDGYPIPFKIDKSKRYKLETTFFGAIVSVILKPITDTQTEVIHFINYTPNSLSHIYLSILSNNVGNLSIISYLDGYTMDTELHTFIGDIHTTITNALIKTGETSLPLKISELRI